MNPEEFDPNIYLPIFEQLRTPRRHLTSAPTFTPRNAVEQRQLFDNGTTRGEYVWINGTWRFFSAT